MHVQYKLKSDCTLDSWLTKKAKYLPIECGNIILKLTFLKTLGGPGEDLSILSHLLDIALLKPILALGTAD